MLADCCCGYCRENNQKSNKLDVQEGQWLEELGEMIEAAVAGVSTQQSFTAGCYGGLAGT